MKSCIKCEYYSMATEEDRGRTSFDFCEKKGDLPTSAFSFNDVCCGNGTCFNIRAFFCLEEMAEKCEYYKSNKKRE
jgi:hypothetical protein